MTARGTHPPPGYLRETVGRTEVVALVAAMPGVRAALAAAGTLYEYAASAPGARTMHGRAPVYAARLPHGGGCVVVRRSRHGGVLAPVTGELFAAPTRAPHELALAVALRAAGVPTPEVVAYAVYTALPLLRRADVATREVADANDLGELLGDPARAADGEWIAPVAELLGALARAGARHHDLNIKNVLLARSATGDAVAMVLDVDRVVLGRPGDAGVARANWRRLARSAVKRRGVGLAHATDAQLAALAAAAGVAAS